MKILIIKLGAMGDVLRTTCILSALHEKYQEVAVEWVTAQSSYPLLKDNALIDAVYGIEDQDTPYKDRQYDLVISLDDEEQACQLASEIQAKELVGAFTKEGKRTYTPQTAPWFDMSLISAFGKERADQLKKENTRSYPDLLFQILGLQDHQSHLPVLELTKAAQEFAGQFKEKHSIEGKVVGINTGAGTRWREKSLPIEQTLSIVQHLHESKVKIILLGGPSEEQRNKELLKQAPFLIDGGCHNTIQEFAALISLCDSLLCSDSLAMHIGIALKKYIVAFFYPTSAAEIELYGRGVKSIGKGESFCSYQRECTHPPLWNTQEMSDALLNSLQK